MNARARTNLTYDTTTKYVLSNDDLLSNTNFTNEIHLQNDKIYFFLGEGSSGEFFMPVMTESGEIRLFKTFDTCRYRSVLLYL